MITEKDTIKCESIFNDDRTHRFLWKRVWNKDKPLMAVIMLNPCHSDNIVTDTTTSLVVNNVARLEEYGGVEILNLYSLLTPKLNFRWNDDSDLNHEDNDSYIKKAAEECKTVLLAWGRSGNINQRIEERVVKIINLLQPYEDKLYMITDGIRIGLHPLTPCLRNTWKIVPFNKNESVNTDNGDENNDTPIKTLDY